MRRGWQDTTKRDIISALTRTKLGRSSLTVSKATTDLWLYSISFRYYGAGPYYILLKPTSIQRYWRWTGELKLKRSVIVCWWPDDDFLFCGLRIWCLAWLQLTNKWRNQQQRTDDFEVTMTTPFPRIVKECTFGSFVFPTNSNLIRYLSIDYNSIRARTSYKNEVLVSTALLAVASVVGVSEKFPAHWEDGWYLEHIGSRLSRLAHRPYPPLP